LKEKIIIIKNKKMKKVIFGIDVNYTKENNKWKKSQPIFKTKWSEIKETQPIKKNQTVVIRLGKEFGIMCLDLDTKDANHPDFKLIQELYELQPTAVNESQNGFHLFYKWDKRLAKTSSKVTKGEKLDIKSNMGIINIKAPNDYYHWWETKYGIAEFTNEMWELLKPKLTNKYLDKPQTITDAKSNLKKIVERYEDNPTKELEKRINTQTNRILNWNKKPKNYDQSEIKRARSYPIRRLLNEPTATVIKCPHPDHDDKTPSCQINGNFAYCHGCQEHMDAIDICMMLTSKTFSEAIKELNK